MNRQSQRQTIPAHLRYTINHFNEEFPDDDSCLEYIKEDRWPNGVTWCESEKCNTQRKHHRVSGRTAYACDHCGHHIYPLAGTIFEKSTTSLRLWFYAMYLMGSTRCGISAKQIQRETGVTYKTAWRMFKQIRSLLGDNGSVGGRVEIDETYMGGRRKYGTGRPMAGDKTLTPVIGIVKRQGKIIAKAVPDVKAKTLLPVIKAHVFPESTIYTDELKSYNKIENIKGGMYHHRRINHSSRVYVQGDVHTNTIEGFWSLLKRGIGGVYHQVSQKYLQTYLDEYSFRYNHRDEGNLIFKSILEQVSGRAV